MTDPTLLIVAKAPVPGFAKTRIALEIGDVAAAELAAAALLDTLATAQTVGWSVVVALTGDLARAERAEDIIEALGHTTVIEQRGDSLGERLAHAHHDADAGFGVVQVGMDTPQLTIDDYLAAGSVVRRGGRTIGPAEDGGWWLLGLANPREAQALEGVAMSLDDTCARTERAFGHDFILLRLVRDMDSWEDAQIIAKASPGSRLARVIQSIEAYV